MLRNRLPHTVTVTSYTEGATDIYNNPVVSASSSVEYDGYVEPLSSMEDIIDRDTRVSYFRLTLAPEAAIGATDTVTYDSQTFRVRGKPREVYKSRGVSHIEVDLELVEG